MTAALVRFLIAVAFAGAIGLACGFVAAVVRVATGLRAKRHQRLERDAVEHAAYLRRLTVATADLRRWYSDTTAQDVAEYAVMLAVILVLVIGTVRLVGGNANNVFSSVGSNLNQ